MIPAVRAICLIRSGHSVDAAIFDFKGDCSESNLGDTTEDDVCAESSESKNGNNIRSRPHRFSP